MRGDAEQLPESVGRSAVGDDGEQLPLVRDRLAQAGLSGAALSVLDARGPLGDIVGDVCRDRLLKRGAVQEAIGRSVGTDRVEPRMQAFSPALAVMRLQRVQNGIGASDLAADQREELHPSRSPASGGEEQRKERSRPNRPDP